jgi:antitoxin MazE
MKIPIVSIGNSKGIRFSKTVIQKYHLQDEVELIFEEEALIIKPIVKARKNWDAAFTKMHEQGDDKLIINDVFEDENFEA